MLLIALYQVIFECALNSSVYRIVIIPCICVIGVIKRVVVFKHDRVVLFVQECEASPHCRRLQLKDLLVSEMQRLTKYPLLLDKIVKYTEGEEKQIQHNPDHKLSCC